MSARPVALFVNAFDPSDTGWVWHTDGPGTIDVVTAVLTVRSQDCTGGQVKFSDNDDGSYDDTEDTPSISFMPEHGSVYIFPGSLVRHCPTPIVNGKRHVVVAFYEVSSDQHGKLLGTWAATHRA